ncbi:MAG TPA: DNA polymerase III subunit epsilon [Steroidobacteraceae bacterium]|jgi:DNA polymerase-3 subunit epsilon|nr:DNA polymerase III subunit epsilon [Steroidobacteraceae bacterium]
MRQIILDTETTGLEAGQNHRIIEIGALELVSRRPTGRHFHQYLNPERDIDEGALEVHGISRARLESEPKFAQIAAQLIEFLRGAELIIHNAAFDVAFLDAEFARLPGEPVTVASMCAVVDSLALARQMHPGQRNSLDALCKRYSVDHSGRQLHGALLDAQLLGEVYLAMTGGQVALRLGESGTAPAHEAGAAPRPLIRAHTALRVVSATPEEELAHEAFLELIGKSSKGRCLWQQLEAPNTATAV